MSSSRTTLLERGSEVPAHLKQMGVRLSLREYLGEMWERREFLLTVPLSELRAQNQNTVLGSLWHLLNPLFLAGVFYLVFGVILGARAGIEFYPAFLVIGIFTYMFFQKCVSAGARTVTSNIKLIQSLSFPRAVLPVAVVIGEFIAQLTAMLAMLVIVLIVVGDPPTLAWLLIVPALLVNTVFNLGAAFMTARMTFHFRDTANFLPYVLRILLYFSGVFFSPSFVPEGLPRTLFSLNPLYNFILINRQALLPTEAPSLRPWLIVISFAVGSLALGFAFFRRAESEYGLA